MSDERERLERDVADAGAEVDRIRADNAELAEAYRKEPGDASRELLKRGARSLDVAKARFDAAVAALTVFDKTGSPYGLLAEDGRVFGTMVVMVRPGIPRDERARAIDDALGDELADAAEELGVVLTTSPEHYTRELPGRDAQGRTVLEVAGRVECDRLVPAVSIASRKLRN